MDKKQKIAYIGIGLFAGFLIFGLKKNSEPNYFSRDEKYDIIYDTVSFYHINKDKLVEAFIQIESSGSDDAVNEKTKASGCLQLMPVMVNDANRISGKNYSLDDRFNRKKSIEMFHIIMEHYNPNYDLHLACKLWNPKSSVGYHRKIEKKYNELLNK